MATSAAASPPMAWSHGLSVGKALKAMDAAGNAASNALPAVGTTAGAERERAIPQAAAAETNMMLLSAWNEHDEGHWIAPTLEKYGGTEKLEAIKRAIDASR